MVWCEEKRNKKNRGLVVRVNPRLTGGSGRARSRRAEEENKTMNMASDPSRGSADAYAGPLSLG